MHSSLLIQDQPPQPAAPPSARIDGGELLRILKRRSALIAIIVGAITGLALIAVLIMTPEYAATSRMVVASSDPANGGTETVTSTARDELIIASEMQKLRARPLARAVVEKLKLQNDAEFAPAWVEPSLMNLYGLLGSYDSSAKVGSGDIESATDTVAANLSVDRVSRSNFIAVTATSKDPRKAALIADAMVVTHAEQQLAEKRALKDRAVTLLAKRVRDLREDIVGTDRSLAAYRQSKGLFNGLSRDADIVQMSRLNGALADARAARAETATRAARIRSLIGADTETMAGSTIAASPLLADLRRQDAELSRRIAELSSYYGKGYPDLINARAQRDEVRKRLSDEVTRIGKDVGTEVALSNSVIQARESQLLSDIGALRSESFRQGAAAVDMADMEQDASATRTLYATLLARLKDIRGQTPAAEITVASLAGLPSESSSPTTPIVVVAFIGSLMLAFVVAFAAETMDDRMRTGDQVERMLGIPTLAMVPELPRDMRDRPNHLAVFERPSSVFAESMRSLLLELARHGPRTVVVTSPLPGEGKTTIALSLAATSAVLGRTAVIVDLDLRRPGLVDEMAREEGQLDLVDFLSGDATLDDILVGDEQIPNLARISLKRPPHDPGALISSPRLQELLDQLKQRFSFVILNAPPILPVRDAKTLAEIADATILVLRWGETRTGPARAAVDIFHDTITGAVINRVDYRRHARRAYGDSIQHYHQYDGYYNETPASSEALEASFRRLPKLAATGST
jgi:capsular exopolysaccharide synthesis family protein